MGGKLDHQPNGSRVICRDEVNRKTEGVLSTPSVFNYRDDHFAESSTRANCPDLARQLLPQVQRESYVSNFRPSSPTSPANCW